MNPIAIQGQIEGGVLMSMGYALTERLPAQGLRPPGRASAPSAFSAPTRSPDIRRRSTSRRSTSSPWRTAARALARSPPSPRRPLSRTPIAGSTACFGPELPLEGTPYSQQEDELARGRKSPCNKGVAQYFGLTQRDGLIACSAPVGERRQAWPSC
ncbi:MAG: hypothetical protein LKE45_04480 [Olsenella sp.]|nr:hypothetical protein [Olsenella sp.]